MPFIEKDVNASLENMQEYRKLGVNGVPTFVIGDEVIVGFNPQAVMEKLDFRVIRCEACQKRMLVPKDKGRIRVTCPHCENRQEIDS